MSSPSIDQPVHASSWATGRFSLRRADVLRIAGALCTGFLLASAFPPLQWQDAAWVALIPLLVACRFASLRTACRLGFLSGLVFWLCSIHWLTHVTYGGWVILSAYCALYFIPAALLTSWWLRGRGVANWAMNLAFMVVLSLVWSGSEYLRSTLFTGFPWNPFGGSQYQNLIIIQIASWGGVYAVSALLVFLNAGLAMTILCYMGRGGRRLGRPHVELMVAVTLLALCFAHGWRCLRRPLADPVEVRVCLVQPAIPQTEKWDRAQVDLIYERLSNLTASGMRAPGLDLVVWPETAVPDDILLSERSSGLVRDLVTNGVPILVGSMDSEWVADRTPCYYNSSFLFNTNGVSLQGYDKRHLVMFGEYIPLERVFPFMTAMTPIEASFTAGRTSTVFRLASKPVTFSALICFEDTVAALARESVLNGARLLINQTNDAWFDVSVGSRQHMTHCVFRCVENRVPALRAANTGVTCTIDAWGRVENLLEQEDGNTIFPGFVCAGVMVPGPGYERTFYGRHGDRGAQCAAVLTVGMMLCILVGARRNSTSQATGL